MASLVNAPDSKSSLARLLPEFPLDEVALNRAFDAQRMVAHRQRFLDALTWRN